MQRRTALKQIGILAGGAMLLPSCIGKTTAPAAISLNKLVISGQQENLLALMAEALIPKTDTPGAREVKAHHFVLHMLDDCYEMDAQQKFLSGFAQAQQAIEAKTGKEFEDCSLQEQQTFLKEIEEGKIVPQLKAGEENNLEAFYKPFKGLTIRGYLGSEYIMTNIFGYNMIPGKFQGVVELSADSDLKTILG
ncbi:MAG: gluconate 2-dehydrogenase subunit 3 family protein [Cyclobacteriaceae bacterium]|nr:gluconate 2-dehydrogenase subunit 3 family protein [Cyclobacteriaceae bacterium]